MSKLTDTPERRSSAGYQNGAASDRILWLEWWTWVLASGLPQRQP
jgi:hypothetical protein